MLVEGINVREIEQKILVASVQTSDLQQNGIKLSVDYIEDETTV